MKDNNPKHRAILLGILIILISGLDANARARRGNVYAVVVGVSEYALPGATNLTYPAKEARDMYGLLSKHTTPDKIALLTNRNATRENIMNVVNRLFTATNPDDVVILYFSGHGYEGGFAAHNNSIAYTEFKKIFKRTKARRKLIFADACHSGEMRSREINNRANLRSLNNQKVCLFLSSRSSQLSMETSAFESGFFTHYLMMGLRGGADADRNKVITARELFNFVNPRVKEYSKGRQIPVMWGKFEDRMEILNWNR
ncbi:caspase family protein [Bacteroides sp. UBA939]|uniref:caspase family protein n=1 Tax=Bacteroides sp. UBA939 TaxID=1946092 RepID=UPI0025C5ACE9|nr:caspase family protein [Bacteroides sp. UBA939]